MSWESSDVVFIKLLTQTFRVFAVFTFVKWEVTLKVMMYSYVSGPFLQISWCGVSNEP